jgi:hypothetical protein
MMNVSNSVVSRVAAHALKDKSLEWRHHGVGMLQAYFHEGDEEVRIHVWHPTLTLAGFDATNGIIHDHRFGFTSYVLLGSIYNEHWSGTRDDEHGEWIHYSCVNARQAKNNTGKYHELLGPTGDGFWSYARQGRWYEAGEDYNFAPRQFHFSRVKELTVTLVVKTALVDGPARILGKNGVSLKHAFEYDHDVSKYFHILDEASVALG